MFRQSIYIFSSKMIGYAFRLALPMVLARLLTKADFGGYRQFFLMEVLFTSMLQLGINQALYYYIPRDEKNAGAYFLNSLALNTGIFAVAFTVIGFSAGFWAKQLNMPLLTDYFWQLAGETLLLTLAVTADCYLVARQFPKASAVFEIEGQLLASVFTLFAAWRLGTLGAIFTGLVLARFVQFVTMLGWIQLRLHGFRAERYWHDVWPQVKYGAVLGLGGILITQLARLSDLMVSRYQGVEGYAVFSAGCTDIRILTFYSQALAVVSLGRFAQMEKDKDWAGIHATWNRILTSMYCATLPVVVGLVLFAKPLILFMFSAKYVDAVPIFRLSAILQIQLIWNASLVLRAMGRNDVTVYAHAAHLAVAPFLYKFALDHWGLQGMMLTSIAVQVNVKLLSVYILNRLSKHPLPYFTRPSEMAAFYREMWHGARRGLRRLRAAPAR